MAVIEEGEGMHFEWITVPCESTRNRQRPNAEACRYGSRHEERVEGLSRGERYL